MKIKKDIQNEFHIKVRETIFLFFLSFSATISFGQTHPLRLWYDKPASLWEECVPLGNGHLGAMPDGGIVEENIVLNDITLWSGGKQDADNPYAHEYLQQIRQLLFEGKNIEAQEIMDRHFVCSGEGSGNGNGANVPYGSFQVLGNLHLHYDYGSEGTEIKTENYYRELSLDSALAKTVLTVNNTVYSREYFAGFGDDAIIIKLTADQLKKISFTLSLDRPERFETKTVGDVLQMAGRMDNGTDGNGMRYIVRIALKPEGGKIIQGQNSLQLKDANAVTIYIAAETDYMDSDYLRTTDQVLASCIAKPYAALKAEHVKKYQMLFHRASLDIGGISRDSLPTDKRLIAFANHSDDNGLPVLYFQYGRYLLISSTKPGVLPPNLQGLWANTIQTPWNGDYHLNINIQMNHWPLDVTNLGSLNEPFFSLVKSLTAPGKKTAKAYYEGKGWVAHVITNVWGYTSPGEHYSWGSFNTGSAWLCQMLWSHYEFTRDTAYLRMLYPIMRGSAEFYLSTLVKEPTHGWLVTAPSNSPENAFILPNGKQANVCDGPTIDNQIIRFLFSATIEACKRLKTDASLKLELEKAILQLPPDQISSDGRLREWLQDYKEADPHHRHVSHLWGLYPGNEISMATPGFAKAARASLDARGDNGTGWSLAWKINFWARLHDGNRAFTLLRNLLRPVSDSQVNMHNGGGTYSNLFCAHPPFQIDGNFGGTAGIAEMLLQSQSGYIELLPALPYEWKDGNFSGLCVRGGAEISAGWTNSKLNHVTVEATSDGTFKIKMPENVGKVSIVKNNKNFAGKAISDNFISLTLRKGDVASISF